MKLEKYLSKLIEKELNVKEEDILIPKPNYDASNFDKGRFFIDVLDRNFDGDMENGDPILEQYVLVPISKIQDRLDIILGD